MSDVFDKRKRSQIMGKVKSSQNKSTELELIRIFKKKGIKGWRRNYGVIGKPDFVFLDKRIAVFTDGCFWHGHKCRNTKPSSNAEYWERKIERNMKRDRKVNMRFKERGWKVFRIWECRIKRESLPRTLLKTLLD